VVRERPVDALVFSVHECGGHQLDQVDSLVRRFPEIPTVALVTRPDPAASELLLRLGASGIRHVVDVTSPTGWARLRHLLLAPVSRPAARIMARVFGTLTDLPADTRLFLELIIRLAPSTPVARRLAGHARMRPSTLMSRFARAGLPSLKSYVAAIRLLYAAQLFESEGLSVSDVAYRLECSSPQSFGRHLRATLGVTPGEFRRRFGFERAMSRFMATLIDPFVDQWRNFHPLEPGGHPREANGGSRARPG
jgi:AraC-like DNA-binding protein